MEHYSILSLVFKSLLSAYFRSTLYDPVRTHISSLSLSLSLSRRAYARFSQQKKTCAYRSTVLALQTVIHEAVLLPIFLPYLLTISLYSLQINGSCFLVPVIYYSKKLH